MSSSLILFYTVCPHPPSSEISQYNVTYKTEDRVFLPGTKVHNYTCDMFYTLSEGYPNTITCLHNGTWNYTEPPVCVPSKLVT